MKMGEKEVRVDQKLRLQQIFEDVRSNIFPRWDTNFLWKVVYDHQLPSQGLCCPKDKRIVLSSVPSNDDELRLLLIHEICHSSALGHDERWSERMLKAADRAEKAGWLKVADLVRAEVEMYQESPRVRASWVYERISDCLMDIPGASYEKVIALLAREYGMYADDFKIRFKRCRLVYEKAWDEHRIRLKIRQKFNRIAEN